MTTDRESVNPDHTAADEAWWAEQTREDDWQDGYTWEIGPAPDDDGPTDEEWDAMAGEAAALAAMESCLRFF